MFSIAWATVDRLKLQLRQSGTDVIQDAFYNGWAHDQYDPSVFHFFPDRTVPSAFFNVPGCVHDILVANYADICTKLESEYEKHGGKCTVDLAFGGIQHQ